MTAITASATQADISRLWKRLNPDHYFEKGEVAILRAYFGMKPRWFDPPLESRAGALTVPNGPGVGIVRLVPDATDGGALKAWSLLTALDGLRGHDESIGKARPKGESYSRDFRGPNWLDLRQAAATYSDHDPAGSPSPRG